MRRVGVPAAETEARAGKWPDTLLRRVKQAARARPPSKRIPALGLDDWAWRKGYGRYGAILVDLKRRKVADLLPECSARAVEQWLRQHPGVKIISRDRQGSLANGARRGAPAACQVADRFHLIQNLQQAVHTELLCQRAHLKIAAEEFTREAEMDQVPEAVQNISRPRRTWANPSHKQVERQRWQHKLELFEMVKSLRAQGAKVIAIMRQAGISRGLANKWLGLEECPPRAKRTSRPGMPEDFREELWRRWEQGQQEGKQRFRGILCNGKVTSLRDWIKKAEAAGIGVIRAFVRQLKRDMAAVENAVEQVWSNGPVEGHINRLKNLKRRMYGRAKFELLRARTLPLAA